jgi:hypothetical protein
MILGKNILKMLSQSNTLFSSKANIQLIGDYKDNSKVDIIGTYLKFVRYRNIFF